MDRNARPEHHSFANLEGDGHEAPTRSSECLGAENLHPIRNGVAEAERRFPLPPVVRLPRRCRCDHLPAGALGDDVPAGQARAAGFWNSRRARHPSSSPSWAGPAGRIRCVTCGSVLRVLRAAVAYARRQGLRFTVQEPQERRHLVMPSLDDARRHPSRWFGRPQEVADGPLLTEREKREVLKRWLWDARLIETAVAEGMPDRGEASRLDDLLDALARLRAQNAQPTATADTARAATCRAAANWARAA